MIVIYSVVVFVVQLVFVIYAVIQWNLEKPSIYRMFRTHRKYWTPTNPPPQPPTIHKNRKIFISIASYRDPDIAGTVCSLVNGADYPEMLTVGVLEQNDVDDVGLSRLPAGVRNKTNLVHKVISHRDALGPTWARYILQTWITDEYYFMQIDSHTRVVRHWDTELVSMLEDLPPRSVLTQYPPEYREGGKCDINQVRSELYVECFGRDRFTRIQSEFVPSGDKLPGVFVSEAWAACFSFSTYHIVLDAPYDPYTPYLFFGEELDITLRLWTRGWNFYSPGRSLVFTDFSRKNRKTIWSDHEQHTHNEVRFLSNLRIYNRLGFSQDILDFTGESSLDIPLLTKNYNIYKLGNTRTLETYQKHAGVNLTTKKITGHNLRRILNTNRHEQLLKNNL